MHGLGEAIINLQEDELNHRGATRRINEGKEAQLRGKNSVASCLTLYNS